MKYSLILFTLVLASLSSAHACGPTPQKVSKEITIHAPPDKVWAVVNDFGGVAKWNTQIANVRTKEAVDETGKPTQYREIILKDGGIILDKLHETPAAEMKQDVRIENTTLPISQYRGVMTVKQGENPDDSVVIWTGRFNNQANLMDPPAGQDNATAIAAISKFYDAGLEGLKKVIEQR